MTRTNRTGAKANANTAATAAEMAATETARMINDTLETLRPGLEMPAAARDFVAGQAATAQARVETAQKGASELNAQANTATMTISGAYARFADTMIALAAANASHALSTVGKLATAKSVPEAVQIQTDFVRDNARANFDRFRDLADTGHKSMTELATTTQETARKAWSLTTTAAA